jgi:hypothetical protein
MAYNVDTWKTKKLKDLRLPVASLFKSERKDWHPNRREQPDGTVRFSVCEDVFIIGRLDGDVLVVSNICARGEGSGTALQLVIEPALADSRGTLVVRRVWEGGDSIDELTVVDGEVKSEAIEL